MRYGNELPKSDKLADAVSFSGYAASEFRVAYYVLAHSQTAANYHFNDGLAMFEKAARALGYTLTPIQEAPHVATDATSKPDSGRLNLSNESPAPSDLNHNFGA